MTADHLIGIEQFEADLWKVADNLRANSNLASNEYFMPILGLIFLRHATNRYYAALAAIEEDKAAGKMPDRPLVEADFTRRRALMLPQPARYDVLLGLPKDGNLGAAVTVAMEAVEDHFPPLAGQLPKDYQRFEDDVLEEMMRIFDSEALRTASGDVFGRIYEYFLAEFSKEGAHDNGEFFTPPSIVQTIVNVIEADHGVVLDPACGSGGMFVQSSHFIEDAGEDTMKRVTFYGHEKNEPTAKLAQINLAVHGLEGRIRAGNEAITYYKDPHELVGECDFVMANPPFNVDEVDAEKVRGDKRLPFGLPGVNKDKKVSNANYLWLQYFYSYLNENGRAGVVISSQASSAGRDEAKVRQKLIESGAVDVMIDIRGNFFYKRTVPCQLWFFDRTKEQDEVRCDQILMLDARNIHRKVSRAIFDFSPEQQKNIAAIVWLYRGQSGRFLKLVESYLAQAVSEGRATAAPLAAFKNALGKLVDLIKPFAAEKRDPDSLAKNWEELVPSQATLSVDTKALEAEVGVDPNSWTPDPLGRRYPPCRDQDRRTRRSSGARWLSWCEPDGVRKSCHESSSRRRRRSATGSCKASVTRGVAGMGQAPRSERSCVAFAERIVGCAKNEISWQKPRPGLLGGPYRGGLPVHESESGRVSNRHDGPSARSLPERVLRVAHP